MATTGRRVRSGPLTAPSPVRGVPEAAGGGDRAPRNEPRDNQGADEVWRARWPVSASNDGVLHPCPHHLLPECEACWKRAYRYSYARLRNHHDAEDAVQEAVVRTLYRVDCRHCRHCELAHRCYWCRACHCRLGCGCHFFGVLRIAVSYVARVRQRFQSDITLDALSVYCTCCGHAESTCTLRLTIKDEVSKLAPPYRAVVHLRYWCDLSIDEIAQQIDEPSSRVRRWHRAALRMLCTGLRSGLKPTRCLCSEERYCHVDCVLKEGPHPCCRENPPELLTQLFVFWKYHPKLEAGGERATG